MACCSVNSTNTPHQLVLSWPSEGPQLKAIQQGGRGLWLKADWQPRSNLAAALAACCSRDASISGPFKANVEGSRRIHGVPHL